MEAREPPAGITFLLYPHGSQQKISELGLAESAFIYLDNKLAHSFLEISIFGIFLVHGGGFQSFFFKICKLIYFVYMYTVFGVSSMCLSTYEKFRGKVRELAASFHHIDL